MIISTLQLMNPWAVAGAEQLIKMSGSGSSRLQILQKSVFILAPDGDRCRDSNLLYGMAPILRLVALNGLLIRVLLH